MDQVAQLCAIDDYLESQGVDSVQDLKDIMSKPPISHTLACMSIRHHDLTSHYKRDSREEV